MVTLAAVIVVISAIFLAKGVDFRVYWYGVGDFLKGIRPLYGPLSGIGYPQEFRYPPVTVLFFLPLAHLPLRVANICFELLGWAGCTWATILAIAKWKLRFTAAGTALGFAIMAQFIILAVKFGNVQPHLIALVLLALLWTGEHPRWSGLALAVATCFKVWPLFFAPWFLVRGRRWALAYAAAASAALWTAPILFFGWARYEFLLRDFFNHVVALASAPESVWYSSQSLRGVLFRFLTHSVPPRDGYPDVSFAALSPSLISAFVMLLSIAAYGYAVTAMWRVPVSQRWIWDAGSFVFFSVLQPFCMNSGLISLFPAVLAAACVYSAPDGEFSQSARRWFLAACSLAVVASVTFYRSLQREALMLGIDFWIMLALGMTLVMAAHSKGKDLAEAPACTPGRDPLGSLKAAAQP